jgi:hypothetical protein
MALATDACCGLPLPKSPSARRWIASVGTASALRLWRRLRASAMLEQNAVRKNLRRERKSGVNELSISTEKPRYYRVFVAECDLRFESEIQRLALGSSG